MAIDDGCIIFDLCRYYKISGVIVSSESVEFKECQEVKLPEHLRLLLNYFIENPNCLVSKVQASKIMWGEELKDDISVIRAIAMLRKILKDSHCSSISIQTVRKRGFIFTVVDDVLIVDSSALSNYSQNDYTFLSNKDPFAWRVKWALFLVVCLVCVCFFINIFITAEKSIYHLKSRDISILAGTEFYPVVSPDDKYVVYSHSVDRDKDFSIILHELNSGSKKILKTDKYASMNGFVWLRNMAGLYYQRLKSKEFCEIRKISFKQNRLEVASDDFVADCGMFSVTTRLQLTADQRFLIFSTRPENNKRAFIKKLSIDNLVSHQITTPLSDGFGDYNMSLSPNGKFLAFLRDKNFTHSQLWLLNIDTGEFDLLYEDYKNMPYMISWSLDGEKILWPNESSNVFSFDLATRRFEVLFETDRPVIELVEFKKDQYVSTTGAYWNSSLWQVNNPLKNSTEYRNKFINSSLVDMFVIPNKIDGGSSAVLSTGSGECQLWFYLSDGRKVQITDIELTDKRIHGQFSNDGTTLLLRSGRQLWLVRPGLPSIKLPITVDISSLFSWSSDDKSVYYSTFHFGQVGISKLRLKDGVSETLDKTLKFYEESPDGKYAIQLRYGQPYFEMVSKETSEIVAVREISDPELVMRRLIIRNSGLYFTQKVSDSHFEVMRYNLATSQLETTGVTQTNKGRSLYVSLDEEFIYLDDGVKGNLEISILTKPSD